MELFNSGTACLRQSKADRNCSKRIKPVQIGSGIFKSVEKTAGQIGTTQSLLNNCELFETQLKRMWTNQNTLDRNGPDKAGTGRYESIEHVRNLVGLLEMV